MNVGGEDSSQRHGTGEGIQGTILLMDLSFSVTRDHGSSALNRDLGLGFWKSSGGGYGGDDGGSHWRRLRPC